MNSIRILARSVALACAVAPLGLVLAAPVRLYVAGDYSPCIDVMNIDGTARESIVRPTMYNPQRMAYGPDGRIYWIGYDCWDLAIRRCEPDGSNVETLPHRLARAHPGEIEIDPLTGLLYIVDNDLDRILVSNPDGTDVRTLMDHAVHDSDIALDSQGGRIYWVGSSTSGSDDIYVADLADGSNPEILYTSDDVGLDFFRHIALHPSGQWLFVSSGRSIYRIDLTTDLVTLVLTDDRSYLSDLLVDESEVCFSSSDGDPAVRCAGLDGANLRIVADHMASGGLALDTSGQNLFWTSAHTIRRAERAGGTVHTVLQADVGQIQGLSLDLDNEKMYWTQRHMHGISVPAALMRANLDGTDREVLIADGRLIDPRRIAVDSVRDKLFVVDAGANAIYTAKLDGSDLSTLVADASYVPDLAVDTETGILYWYNGIAIYYFDETRGFEERLLGSGQVSALAIDPFDRLLFWAFSLPSTRSVRRAALEHDASAFILASDLGILSGLAVDFVSDRVYWADRGFGVVQSARYDGSDVIVVSEDLRTPGTMALDWRRDPGDRDGNGVVDEPDVQGSNLCLGGPGAIASHAHCGWMDLDSDGDVDLADIAEFWVHAGE